MKRIALIVITLTAALTLMAACAAPAAQGDTTRPYVSVSFDYGEGLRYDPSYAV
jgi:ABC-type glycerol-3-phosphate transport system substrate-binding protein